MQDSIKLPGRYTGPVIALAMLFILFVPVFYTDYAYLDEAYELWNNKGLTNYNVFFTQGRWLSGVLFNHLFAGIAAIASLKIMRVISLLSWAVFIIEFFRLGKKWQRLIGFDDILLTINGVYIACSLSVAICIGWASCFEAGIATILGLWSGHISFGQLMKKEAGKSISFIHISFILLSGLACLFMYQTAFGAFLIPFAIYLITKKSRASPRIIITGAIAYIAITVLYYLLFLLSMKINAVTASDRTEISMDILGKLSFFFSMPLSQAFSFNFLYNTHSIPSQAFPILMMAGWVISCFKMDRGQPINKIIFIGSFIGLCMLTYLPLLAGDVYFSPYRTMFVFNFIVSFLLIALVLSLATSKKRKTVLAVLLITCFTGFAFRNFRYNFAGPVQQEYKLVRHYFNENYHAGIDTIFFLRPPENAFYAVYGINSYKDEFGLPSTYKDWTPEPLMKQFILEKTNNRSIAEKAAVIQFTDRAVFETAAKNKKPWAMYLDPESLFK